MVRRRPRSLPRGVFVAGWIVKRLSALCGVKLFLVCALLAFACGAAKVAGMAVGNMACELPSSVGGPGVEVFGDSALLGLTGKLSVHLAGGAVVEDVVAGRTAEQAENALNSLPDDAPHTFVVSLAADDSSSESAYRDRIEELTFMLAGRTVYWVTAPGEGAYTRIVTAETLASSGWQIVDLAASVSQHPDWWRGGKLTDVGLTNLAGTLTAEVSAAADARTGPIESTRPITVTSASNWSNSFILNGERLANARTIVSVGLKLGVPQRGLVIAVATAAQESKFVNLPGGPAGAHGLFQQTPPWWGTVAQVMDPTYAATAFYSRLLKVPGWQDMALTDAAQAVQQSGYPDAYAQWESSATLILAALTGQHVAGCGPQVGVPGNPNAQIAVNAALSQLGVPYSFAGGNLTGPTLGVCVPSTDGWNDCHIVGFDCSGLMLYAWGKAGVSVPHFTGAMWTDPDLVHLTDKSQLQPGDMMMFENPPGHIGMYIGNGQLVDAPHSASVVKIESVDDPWYAQTYIGALRPKV